MKTRLWCILPFVVFVLLSLFLWRGLSLNPHDLPSMKIGKKLPDFNLPTLRNSHEHFTSENMAGQIALLNVWASWCNTCNEEQIFLLQLAREGLPVYGLNYKDNPKHARAWLNEWGNPYREIGVDTTGKVAIDLGVYGAPETFLIGADGVIVYRHTGALDKKAWQEEFLPRIKSLRHTG